MSNEQKKYLKSLKRHKLIVVFVQIIIIIGFFLLWEILARKNIINNFVFSYPSKILKTIYALWYNGNLFNHIYITLIEIIIVFSLGIILGFIIAILLYEIPILYEIIDPFLTMFNSLPKVALGPLIIIVCGANIKSVIVMALFINLIISIVTIYNGFTMIDETKMTLIKSFNATKIQILTKLVIPSSYTTIISSLKLNISMSLIGM